MTRIDAKFEDLRARGKKAFVSYVMAGDPDFDRSLELLAAIFLERRQRRQAQVRAHATLIERLLT